MIEHQEEMGEVLVEGSRKDSNIFEIDKDSGHFDIIQDIIHGSLKSGRGITETLRHQSGIKETISIYKGKLFSVF